MQTRLKLSMVLLLSVLAGPLPLEATQRIVFDQLGRQVKLSDSPQRIVSLAPSITEIVFAIGQGDRLQGVTRYSDYPPEARRLPSVGSYVHLDLEKIVGLRPDLCIATKDGNPKGVVERLEQLGIAVYAVDPRDSRSIMQTVEEIGELLGAVDAAHRLAAGMRARIARISAQVARSPSRPGVFFQIGIAPIVSVGTRTFIHELITLAGGANLAAGPTPYPRFSREQILALAPEVWIVTSMESDPNPEHILGQPEIWQHVPAVRNRRVFGVNSDLFDRPSPRLIEALEILVQLIHPELGGA